MTTTFSFRCPECNARLKAADRLRGCFRPCPACGKRIYIAHKPLGDLGPKLLFDDRIIPPAPQMGDR